MKREVKNFPVTVVIPTYNRAHLLRRSIQSVLNQTYKDFELIVVNDGSTDSTQEAVNSFIDKRIKYIKLEKNKGAAAARNAGIKVSRGKYIAFQDSDDEWLPEKLEKQMKAFEDLPAEVGVVYTDMYRISNEGKKIEYWKSPHLEPEDNMTYRKVLWHPLLRNCGIGIQSAVIRKECFDRVGLFDERFPMFIDLEMFIRLTYYFHFFHIKKPLVNFYVTSNSITSSGGGNHIIVTKLIFEKYFGDIKKNRKLFRKYCFWLSDRMIYHKDTFNQGRKYLIMEFLAYPLNIKLFFKILLSFFGIEFYLRMSNIGHGYKKL